MTVYMDVVVLVNFLLDAEILLLLYKLESEKIRPLRLVISALLGGGLALTVFIPYLQPYLSAASRYILPFLMSAVCFLPCKVSRIFRCGVYIFLMSFVFSGIMTFFGIKGVLGLFVIVPVSFAIDSLRIKLTKKHKDAVLCYGKSEITVKGFCDSGNLLTCGGMPVILANDEIFKRLFGNDFNVNAIAEWIDVKDLRYISYTSLGKDGVILGIRLDKAIIDGKVYENVILGYSGKNFAEKVVLSSTMM